MGLKIFSVLLLVSLLSGCRNISFPSAIENDSVQETAEKTVEETGEEVLEFVFHDGGITFPGGTINDAEYHTLSTKGSVENREIQNLINSIEKAQIHENGKDVQIKENSSYTGSYIIFSMNNNKAKYDIRIDLREGNICNLNIYSDDGNMKTYFIDSDDICNYIKEMVSYKVVDLELLNEIQSIEFAQTFQSSHFVLSKSESQVLIDEILRCEKIKVDEINAGIPFVIKSPNNDYFNGKVSPEGVLVAIEQTVYDTSDSEILKEYLKNIMEQTKK